MVNLWKKYDSKKTYDEYLNSDHKLRKQAVIISHNFRETWHQEIK